MLWRRDEEVGSVMQCFRMLGVIRSWCGCGWTVVQPEGHLDGIFNGNLGVAQSGDVVCARSQLA